MCLLSRTSLAALFLDLDHLDRDVVLEDACRVAKGRHHHLGDILVIAATLQSSPPTRRYNDYSAAAVVLKKKWHVV